MHPPDFLHKDAETKLNEHYIAAGAVCSLSTNSEQILDAARNTFQPAHFKTGEVDFRLRFWVDETDRSRPPWPKPYVRGLDHLVFAGFDERSSMLADLRKCRVIGRFSSGMAGDAAYWRMVMFPMLMSILAGSIGLVELHASCVSRHDQGLILTGPSRSGKSTLAMALTKAGFKLHSDDRTFCSLKQERILAYGLPRPLKLRRDGASWFDGIRDQEPNAVQGDERVFYCEPDQRFGERASSGCEPRALIFLDRQQDSSFCLTRMRRSEVKACVEKDLLMETPEVIRRQERILNNLPALPCWNLRFGGAPQVIAEQIVSAFFDNSESNHSQTGSVGRTI